MSEIVKERKTPRCFNLEYLNSLLQRDHAEVVGEYPVLNGGGRITYICICGTQTDKLFRDIAYYGGAYCKPCVTKNKATKTKETCMERYNVSNPSMVEEVKQRKIDTYMENFGDHPKRVKEVNDKFKETCIKRYGHENPAMNEEVKKRIKQTFDERYNGHPMFNDEVKEKVRETCNTVYGGHPATCEAVKQKIATTNLLRYNGHPSQTPEGLDKIIRSSKSYRKYEMPSGAIRNVQGYEPFALDVLLKEYTEEQIKSERHEVPRIQYTHNDRTRYYFPDIYIPDKNLIIEVKSTWTYQLDIDTNKAKEEATKQQGYLYEVWMFDNKGTRIN